ncbi:MAG: PilX N-terminal domain-containing pilus assembly protein [Massilia sp.]
MRARPSTRASGAALVTALFVLLALMIVGLSAAQGALNAELAARAERDRQIAFQAAEAALADAERDIEGGADRASARAALFAPGSAVGFADGLVDGCTARGDAAGLCAYSPVEPAWQASDLAADKADDGAAVEYGRFTGAALPAGEGALTARRPRYLIELLPVARAGEDASERAGNVYRITAIGFGARPSTQVVLQSTYRRVAASEEGAP